MGFELRHANDEICREYVLSDLIHMFPGTVKRCGPHRIILQNPILSISVGFLEQTHSPEVNGHAADIGPPHLTLRSAQEMLLPEVNCAYRSIQVVIVRYQLIETGVTLHRIPVRALDGGVTNLHHPLWPDCGKSIVDHGSQQRGVCAFRCKLAAPFPAGEPMVDEVAQYKYPTAWFDHLTERIPATGADTVTVEPSIF